MLLRPVLGSIRGRLVLAFVGISALTAAFGLFAIDGLDRTNELATRAFKMPLMSVNYSRRSHLDFAAMDRLLHKAQVDPEPARVSELDRLYAVFREDISIARTRSMSTQATLIIGEIEGLVANWVRTARPMLVAPTPGDLRELEALHYEVADRFDTLAEVAAGEGFSLRRDGLHATEEQRITTWAALAALLLATLTMTLVIGRSVLRPLDAAVGVAGRIAAGDLNVEMPSGRTTETEKLFAAMEVMQANLRTKMERETTLRESAQLRLIDAIESSTEGVIVLDAEDRIVVVNSQFVRYIPALADILVQGTKFGDALIEGIRRGLFDASFGTVSDQRARYVKTRATTTFVREIKLTDGRWVRVSRSRTRDDGAVVIWGDITAMKEREEKLDFARVQAEAASRAKSEFLANMSHELRTPLNAINGFAEVLAKEMMGPLGRSEYVEYANVVLDSGRHLLAIINDILDLSKSEAGRLEIETARVDVEEVVQTSFRIMIEQCRTANLHFNLEKEPNLPTIVADATRLRQIVLNLVSNAVKFTEAGGKIVLGVSTDAGELVLRVRDTGIGMRAEDIPLALEPFGQIDSSLSRKYQGTGLGLPLTKRLVELHGGRLDIESAPGSGTEVTVRLPVGPPPVSQRAAQAV